MASTAQSLPQSPPQSPPQTPLQTPQSLARAEALERTLRLCGLVEPSAAEEASLPEALEPPASPNHDDGAASPWPPHGSLPRDVAARPPHGLAERAIYAAKVTPAVFLSGSAVGIYADRGDDTVDEKSARAHFTGHS